MLEIRHLQLLTALREQGSLAAAAEDLYVTASAVSHQLKEIENYYGVSLVNRRSRPLSFTQQAKKYSNLRTVCYRNLIVPPPTLKDWVVVKRDNYVWPRNVIAVLIG